jgi:hypothetical protein
MDNCPTLPEIYSLLDEQTSCVQIFKQLRKPRDFHIFCDYLIRHMNGVSSQLRLPFLATKEDLKTVLEDTKRQVLPEQSLLFFSSISNSLDLQLILSICALIFNIVGRDRWITMDQGQGFFLSNFSHSKSLESDTKGHVNIVVSRFNYVQFPIRWRKSCSIDNGKRWSKDFRCSEQTH